MKEVKKIKKKALKNSRGERTVKEVKKIKKKSLKAPTHYTRHEPSL